MTGHICRRCLLADINGEPLYETVMRYVQNLPQEQRADDALYNNRLQKCRACEQLVNGMCALCGCFVEVRAAKKHMHCAKDAENW